MDENKEKRKVGRPKTWTDEKIESLAKELESWFTNPGTELDRLYYGQFLAEYPDLYPQMVSKFSSVNQVFRETIKRLDKLQEARLLQFALRQKINPVFTMFLLKNKHGYTDKMEVKQETELTTKQSKEELKNASTDDLLEQVRKLTEQGKRNN